MRSGREQGAGSMLVVVRWSLAIFLFKVRLRTRASEIYMDRVVVVVASVSVSFLPKLFKRSLFLHSVFPWT